MRVSGKVGRKRFTESRRDLLLLDTKVRLFSIKTRSLHFSVTVSKNSTTGEFLKEVSKNGTFIVTIRPRSF